MNDRGNDYVPVLVVGGSLVGLSASVFLGRLGIQHRVVERHAATSAHPRGRGNNMRTMELFRTAGLEPQIRKAAATLSKNHGILQVDTLHSGNRRWLSARMTGRPPESDICSTIRCACSQNDLEPVLLEGARALGGDVCFSTELLSFTQDADGVRSIVQDRTTGETHTVTSDYLLAADGPRSPVRTRLGIEHSGSGDLFHNVSVTFRSKQLRQVSGEDHFVVCYVTDPAGEGVLLPVDNEEEWVFHVPWFPERGQTLEDFTDDLITEHVRAAVGVRELDVEVTGKAPWHAADRVANSYREGRVFLMGDAVHEMPPTGAFGSNTGIQDAHNIAWKLAAVLRGWAGPRLLDSYELERRPVAQATSARATLQAAREQHPGYTVRTTSGDYADLMTVALGFRYVSGAIVGAQADEPTIPDTLSLSAEPGTRSPHLWVRREGAVVSTIDLYERSLVLLSGRPGWRDAAKAVAARLNVPLEAYVVGSGADCDLDTGDGPEWASTHGTTPEGAVLVRPDGIVAWRAGGGSPDMEGELGAVLLRVLGR